MSNYIRYGKIFGKRNLILKHHDGKRQYWGDNCEMFKKCKGGCLGTRMALNSFDNPYCLRAIEKNLFKNESLPFRWKIDSKISKYKYLYQKILLK